MRTLALMQELYGALADPVTTKAVALQQAQLEMLQGQITNHSHHLSETNALPHLFYWSAFQLIGSPW
ncbi:MAG: CHAT domain-containing protein [Spirulina sp. SIO3F2]|nr:CHAT domain-containing protein [Spirulina sp. SIO3F2]